MGKQKKHKAASEKPNKGTSLSDQILEDKSVRLSGRNKTKESARDKEFVGEKLTRKILEEARKQQEELQEEHGVQSQLQQKTVKLGSSSAGRDDSDAEEDEEEEWSEGETNQKYDDLVEVSRDEEEALERFMSKDTPARRTLADIIQEKLTEKQTEIRTQMSDNASVQMEQLDDRVVTMYRQIRDILAKYRSGKLPKAFKIIPAMTNWEQILYLTEPDRWSAAAVYQATRIFSSNLNAKMAQRFYHLVLLPRVRDDIAEYKRLNYHLYMAMKKSLFKPAAFFKGVLLPLCESGTCTLREAIIVASILAKNSIPVLHSSAAILKIAEMDYNGANSIFLRTLLDKKYALPYRVIDAVVFHFLRFQRDPRDLPVLWHQSLLTFVQRYKADVSSEQRDALLELLRKHTHPTITGEVRRELTSSKCRDEETGEGGMEM